MITVPWITVGVGGTWVGTGTVTFKVAAGVGAIGEVAVSKAGADVACGLSTLHAAKDNVLHNNNANRVTKNRFIFISNALSWIRLPWQVAVNPSSQRAKPQLPGWILGDTDGFSTGITTAPWAVSNPKVVILIKTGY